MRFGIAVLLLGLAACSKPGSSGTAASAEEAKQYVKQLALSDFEMKAAESFGGQELVEITGKIRNKGARALQKVELTCVFADPYGQPVFRETVSIVRPEKGGLKAGETKAFRLAFDAVPKTWNQATPQMVMAGVVFEQ
jgi:hypothetical protein